MYCPELLLRITAYPVLIYSMFSTRTSMKKRDRIIKNGFGSSRFVRSYVSVCYPIPHSCTAGEFGGFKPGPSMRILGQETDVSLRVNLRIFCPETRTARRPTRLTTLHI
jgi:hypothetical protein